MWARTGKTSTQVCWIILHLFCFELTKAARKEQGPEYLLCRFCGSDTADASYLNHLVSPQAIVFKNQSLYGLQHVGVQLLENPHGNRFHLVTLKKAGCIGKGSWTIKDTWFPGYSWRNCLCTHCGRQLGWIFQPESETLDENKKSPNSFYALIVDSLLSESSYVAFHVPHHRNYVDCLRTVFILPYFPVIFIHPSWTFSAGISIFRFINRISKDINTAKSCVLSRVIRRFLDCFTMSSSGEKSASPDDVDTSNLPDDLKSFLMECNRDFEKRYTEEDEDFAAYLEKESPTPPIVCPWYVRSANRDRGGSRHHDRRDHHHHRPYDNHRNRNSYGHRDRYDDHGRRNPHDWGRHRR